MSDAFWQGFWTAAPIIIGLIIAEIRRELDKRKAVEARKELQEEISKNTEATLEVKEQTSPETMKAVVSQATGNSGNLPNNRTMHG